MFFFSFLRKTHEGEWKGIPRRYMTSYTFECKCGKMCNSGTKIDTRCFEQTFMGWIIWPFLLNIYTAFVYSEICFMKLVVVELHMSSQTFTMEMLLYALCCWLWDRYQHKDDLDFPNAYTKMWSFLSLNSSMKQKGHTCITHMSFHYFH